MTVLIVLIHIVVCLMLIAVILLQAGRGQGLTGASFGGGNVQSLFGTRGADFLQKATTVAAIGFMLTCLGLDYLESQKSKSLLQTGQQVTPLDVETVQKALEKIKQESGAEASADAASESAVAAMEEATEAADVAVSTAQEAVDDKVKESGAVAEK